MTMLGHADYLPEFVARETNCAAETIATASNVVFHLGISGTSAVRARPRGLAQHGLPVFGAPSDCNRIVTAESLGYG